MNRPVGWSPAGLAPFFRYRYRAILRGMTVVPDGAQDVPAVPIEVVPRGWSTLILALAAPLLVLTVAGIAWLNWDDLQQARGLLLFAHLGFLILGLGAVLTVDYTAARGLLLRRSVLEAVRLAGRLDVPIWLGYAGLVGTGILLAPDWTDPVTQVKLALVLAAGLNGGYVLHLRRQLIRCPGDPPTWLVIRGALSATISQSAWWGSVLIGFLHARH